MFRYSHIFCSTVKTTFSYLMYFYKNSLTHCLPHMWKVSREKSSIIGYINNDMMSWKLPHWFTYQIFYSFVQIFCLNVSIVVFIKLLTLRNTSPANFSQIWYTHPHTWYSNSQDMVHTPTHMVYTKIQWFTRYGTHTHTHGIYKDTVIHKMTALTWFISIRSIEQHLSTARPVH